MKRLLALIMLLISAHAWAQSPPCLPQVRWPINVVYGAVPATVSTRFDTYAVWVCALPTGYVTTSSMFVLSNLAPLALEYAAGTWTREQAAADCASTCVAISPAEYAFVMAIVQAKRPKATVGYVPQSATRAVYNLNPDGTLSAAVPGESIAVAKPCDETQRIPGTSYYAVAGQPNARQANSFLPHGSYSSCTITFPIAPN